MTPLFIRLLVMRFRLPTAWMTAALAVVDALMMESPAVRLKLPALLIVPALTMFLTADTTKFKSLTAELIPVIPPVGRIVEITAFGPFLIFRAAIVAVVTAWAE